MLEVVPPWFMLAAFVVLGACIGSFLNVVIIRLPAGESIVRPGSRCPSCRRAIAWYDNLPLLSFILLRARCRHCQARISVRYPIVELLMALLCAALWVRFGIGWDLLLWLPLSAALVAIIFIDIDHWRVPDVITFPAMAFAFGLSFVPGGLSPVEALLGLVPAVLLLGLAWIFERVMGREGMGFGDIKLMGLLGLAVGPIGAFTVLMLGSVQGAVVGTVVALTGGHQPAPTDEDDSEEASEKSDLPAMPPDDPEDEQDEWVPHPRSIPFGPFLALGCFELILLPDIFGNLVFELSGLIERWVW